MSVNPNQTNVTPGTSFYQPLLPCFNATWSTMTTAAVSTVTLSTSILQYVTPDSVIHATLSKDDQTVPSGNCWIVTAAPGNATITYNLAAATSANSQLTIATSVEKY